MGLSVQLIFPAEAVTCQQWTIDQLHFKENLLQVQKVQKQPNQNQSPQIFHDRHPIFS